MTATLREVDLERITRDAQISLSEDANFNGLSPSLHVALPRAMERVQAAVRRLLALLDRIEAGETVPADEVEAIGFGAHIETFRLFRTDADELDRLLVSRIRSIRDRRLAGYSIIVATLALAGIAMGFVMRSLLSARYAEILKNQEEMRAKETRT